MEAIRVRISGKTYAKAHRENWLPSLAIFVFLSKAHSGKNYYFRHKEKTKLIASLAEKYNISFTSFSKHVKILKDNGLISFGKNEMKLLSKRFMLRRRGRTVFVPANIQSLQDIKTFLNTIPILSNLVSQEKAINRIQRYTYISEQSQKKFGDLTSADYRSLKKYNSRGGKMTVNDSLQLSVSKMGELMERKSKNIISKYKKFLKEKGILKIFNHTVRIFNYKISFKQFLILKEDKVIENNSYYYKGYAYTCNPSLMVLAYRN